MKRVSLVSSSGSALIHCFMLFPQNFEVQNWLLTQCRLHLLVFVLRCHPVTKMRPTSYKFVLFRSLQQSAVRANYELFGLKTITERSSLTPLPKLSTVDRLLRGGLSGSGGQITTTLIINLPGVT